MLKKLLAGVLAALIAGSGAGATMTPEQEQQQADQIAKDYVKEYVSDMRAEMKKGDLENLKVSYSKCSAEVCGKEFDLSRRERADYIYDDPRWRIKGIRGYYARSERVKVRCN